MGILKRLVRSWFPDPEVEAIHAAVRRHERKGALVVLADAAGYARPPKIGGYIPDIYAMYSWGIFIEEFENERSIFGTHARRQHAAFTKWLRKGGGRRYEQRLILGGRGGR